ncbi:MAG: hypothetical protein IKE85_06245 [Mogibacterium sp.]|nr:hypothetical protein [Mogibacterium sp.]
MTRKEELLKIINKTGSQNDIKAAQLIDEIVFIEEQLTELKKLPFIAVNPKNPMQQKATPASKQYKEMMQQYNNSLRLLFRLSGDINGENEEESPLRQWVKSRKE